MRRSTRWVSSSALTATLLVVLGLSFGCMESAQEAGWEALNNKVEELYEQGKYREAIPLAKEALKVAKQTFGPDRPAVALSLHTLAGLYIAQGRDAQAEPLFKRALAIRDNALGPD